MKRHWYLVTLLLGASASLILMANPSAADTSPGTTDSSGSYSVAYNIANSGHITALGVDRLDRTVYYQEHTGCAGYFQGNPVYQSEWFEVTADNQNWLELGTGHQCSDTLRYWYWGYGYAGQYYPIGELSGRANEESHSFQIEYNVGTGLYQFQIDSNQYGVKGTSVADHVETGLESHSSTAALGSYPHYDLRYSYDDIFAWYNWSGRHNYYVPPPMCGLWGSDTSWLVGENEPC